MSDVGEQIHEIAQKWKQAFDAASANPALWQPHWPNGQLVVLDEMVRSLTGLIERVRAPAGLGPGFHLAKTLVVATIPAMQTSVSQLIAGQYNYLPTFVGQVQDALSKVHTMIVYSDKVDQDHLVADLSAQLSQALALLETAQRELAMKVETLASVKDLAAAASDAVTTAAAASVAANESQKGVATLLESANTDSSAIRQLKEEISTIRSDADETLSAAQDTMEAADKASVALDEIRRRNLDQSAIIDSILPKGASAGLAAAFAQRRGQLEVTKWVWMAVFVSSLIGLAWAAISLAAPLPSKLDEFWPALVWRLTRAAPFIWLAWVSIVQYGNTIRVQEDYAFKEATSKAFQGYRDHMEHLKSVDVDGAGQALNLLASKTIEILAHEPLRIYNKTDRDASPAHSVIERIFPSKAKDA